MNDTKNNNDNDNDYHKKHVLFINEIISDIDNSKNKKNKYDLILNKKNNNNRLDYTINESNLNNKLVNSIIYAIIKHPKIKYNQIPTSIKHMNLYASKNKITFDEFKKSNNDEKKKIIINICNCKSM